MVAPDGPGGAPLRFAEEDAAGIGLVLDAGEAAAKAKRARTEGPRSRGPVENLPRSAVHAVGEQLADRASLVARLPPQPTLLKLWLGMHHATAMAQ